MDKAKQKRGKKRTVMEREAMGEVIARLDRRGYTQHRMVEELVRLGYQRITQAQVSIDRKHIRERYKVSIKESVDGLVAEKLAQYRDLLEVTWGAYFKSQEDGEREVTEYSPPKKDPEERQKPAKRGRAVKGKIGSVEDSLEQMRVIITREGRLPANEYLRTILMIHQAVRDMLGLDAAQKVENVTTMSIDFNALWVQASEARGSRIVEAKIAAVGAGVPVEGKVIEPDKPSANREAC